MRALAAVLGSLTIPVIYGIMRESGYSTIVAVFSASLVLFGMFLASISVLISIDCFQIMHMLANQG
jgi:dolichyl-phosphate-mannose-protein mannosyltransferase